MRLMVLSIALFFLGCIYFFVNPEKYSSVEKINEGLLDTVQIDTTGWSVAYDNYIKICNPTNRNFETINETIQKNAKEILSTCNRYAQKLGITIIDTVRFNLFSDGLLWISSVNKKSLKDTTELNAIKESLKVVKFGHSKEGKYSCEFSVVIASNGTSQNIILNPTIVFGQDGRTKPGIMKIIMKYIGNMRVAYSRRLRSKPALHGKLIVRFDINQYGRVISVQKDSSTVSDEIFESVVMQQIQHWRFDPLLTDKDTTEVVYPFIFSN